MMSDTYHAGGGDDGEHLADTVAIADKLFDLLDLIVDADLDVERRRRLDNAAGYPTRSGSAGGGGGPTNRMHDFATGKDGTGVSIPQHSDPTGEAAVRDPGADDLGKARRNAYSHMCRMLRSAEAALSDLARTRPTATMNDTERDRAICWPCQDAGITNGAVINDGAPKGVGRPTPRCRNHYQFFLANMTDAPVRAAEHWQRKDRVSPTMMDRWIAEEKQQRHDRARKKNRGRRR